MIESARMELSAARPHYARANNVHVQVSANQLYVSQSAAVIDADGFAVSQLTASEHFRRALCSLLHGAFLWYNLRNIKWIQVYVSSWSLLLEAVGTCKGPKR